jgi:hypothetical protein
VLVIASSRSGALDAVFHVSRERDAWQEWRNLGHPRVRDPEGIAPPEERPVRMPVSAVARGPGVLTLFVPDLQNTLWSRNLRMV